MEQIDVYFSLSLKINKQIKKKYFTRATLNVSYMPSTIHKVQSITNSPARFSSIVLSLLTDEKTEAHKGWVIFPSAHSWSVTDSIEPVFWTPGYHTWSFPDNTLSSRPLPKPVPGPSLGLETDLQVLPTCFHVIPPLFHQITWTFQTIQVPLYWTQKPHWSSFKPSV